MIIRADGGSAFPVATDLGKSEGMSMRDYFAAKAMQGLLANDIGWTGQSDHAAKTAYHMADAMLAERFK